jgi:1,4-alpha-glucan branching enzyme
MVYDQNIVKLITPKKYLSEYSMNQVSLPSASSCGYKGYNEGWLDCSNDCVYPHLHTAGRRIRELAQKFSFYFAKRSKRNLIRRAVNQSARELLLAESSDWPSIMKTGTMVPYAHRRIKQHIERFTRIYNDLWNGSIDKNWLKENEWRDNIFHDMNCAKYYLS